VIWSLSDVTPDAGPPCGIALTLPRLLCDGYNVHPYQMVRNRGPLKLFTFEHGVREALSCVTSGGGCNHAALQRD
jgi:hypothetical protein